MIKVLHIPSGGLFPDGISSFIIDFTAAMDKADLDIRIVAPNNPSPETVTRAIDSGCKIIRIPYKKKNILKYFTLLYKYIREEHIDIVHVHGSSSLMSIELLAAKLADCKIRIAHSHNTTCNHKMLDKILRPLFYNLYTYSLACGEEAGKWLFSGRNFAILHNARDINKYSFNDKNRHLYRKKLGVNNKSLVVGHVGRFNVQKNHEYLIHIFKEIHDVNKNSYLVLIGDGEKLNEIKVLVKQLRIENYVIFTGEVNDVPNYLSAFDVMALPSLHEGLPLVVIEWQIAGLPCIVSDTVTRECAITSLVSFQSINSTPQRWATNILALSPQSDNRHSKILIKQIKDIGYDIALESSRLEKTYLKLFHS